jgi:hypothetical protein
LILSAQAFLILAKSQAVFKAFDGCGATENHCEKQQAGTGTDSIQSILHGSAPFNPKMK